MQWPRARYAIHLLTWASPEPAVHRWDCWKHFCSALDPVFGLSPAKAAIRTQQSVPGTSGWLPFGRMVWNAKNNEKWTEKFANDEGVEFYGTEAWAPDWNTTWKQEVAPDVFLRVERPMHLSVQQALTLAVREPLYTPNVSLIRAAVESMAHAAPGAEQYFGYQRWAEQVWESGYSNGLSDRGALQVLGQLTRVAA